jgi:hypothetical protein
MEISIRRSVWATNKSTLENEYEKRVKTKVLGFMVLYTCT